MDLLLISFHYDRIFQKHETDYTIDTLLKLLQRNRKLYAAINSMQTIFKLLIKRKKLGKADEPSTESLGGPNHQLRARLLVAIKSFLSEHTLFPV